jgi:poly-gamma-glutamate synthesis protein (capsule biosynthesis protein)
MCALLGACGPTAADSDPPPAAHGATAPTVTILLVGDVMLGRGVASVIENDGGSVFEGVRHLIASADISAANLESPLTHLPHISGNPNALEAEPDSATVLSATGFDVMAIPNNHSGDAGPQGLLDTINTLEIAGIEPIGAGDDEIAANAPTIVDRSGLRIGMLAFDTTGTAVDPHIATWNDNTSLTSVRNLRSNVDVLIVSLHGGTEYLPTTDPGMAAIAQELAGAGADVVWGHGAHVVQPVTVVRGARPTVVATSLGNFLFDQAGTDRTTGYMLEVMVDRSGVVAYRVAVTEHPDRRVEFREWLDPAGDAAWLDSSWWSLTREPATAPATSANVGEFRHGDLLVAAAGDIDGDGTDEVVTSFRRPYRNTPFMDTHPQVQWADSEGRSAHLGVHDPDGLKEVWVAGSVLNPIAGLEMCDGSLAVIHDQLDDPTIVSAGAWTWNGFGFDTAPTLAGGGTPACADIDGNGQMDPVILDRD